jgi:hypothetical protein
MPTSAGRYHASRRRALRPGDTIRALQNGSPMSGTGTAHLSPIAVLGQATFGGCVAVVRLARAELRSALPPSIRLPEPDVSPVACLLLFGEQRDAKTCVAGVPMPWGVRYRELMVAVPFVRWTRGEDPYLFVYRMVCDYWPAVWVGNSYYGFSKSFARMKWDGRQFSAHDESDQLLFCAELVSDQPAPRDAFAWIESAARLPVLGRREDGKLVSSWFEWDFEPATVSSATLHVTLGQGLYGPFHEDRPVTAEGAYRVEGMRWRLSWPASVPSV